MRWYTVDYLVRQRVQRGLGVFDRGFWLDGVPRLMLLCRLFGHRPVAEGVRWGPGRTTRPREQSRWVACRRCGIRPEPQGRLNPGQWAIGQTYDGPVATPEKTPRPMTGAYCHPGPWPDDPRGSLGGQLVIGRGFGVVGVELKVGNQASDQALAASITLGNVCSLYLHSERHGQWVQRRLNPFGFESRVVKIAISNGELCWRLWSTRDHERDGSVPRWRHANVRIDPWEILFGPRGQEFIDVGAPMSAMVRMPHGDDHPVRLLLQKVLAGRRRGRKTESWNVDGDRTPGVPIGPDAHGPVSGSNVDLSTQARK